MALQLAITRTGWITESAGKVIGMTLTNTTGDYEVTDNPGGFGTPNLARNEVFIAVFASRYDTATNELVALTVAPYDGLVDDEYTVYFTGDGIFVIHAFAPPIAEPVGTIPIGAQWYNVADSAFMQTVFADTNSGAIAVLDLDTALTGLAEGDVEIHERSIQNANEILDVAFSVTDCCANDCDERDFDHYLKLYAWLFSGVIRAFDQADFFGAAKSLDAINAES